MKKLISMLLAVGLILSLPIMGLAEGEEGAPATSIVVYFSMTGNTETVANLIAEATGSDIVKLEVASPYPEDQEALSARAEEEHADNTLPELTTVIDNIDQYDTIYIGYPIWQGDFPQVIASFLTNYDLSNKTIVPFCTCGSSGLGETPTRIQAMQPAAAMKDGLSITAAEMADAEALVSEWVKGL